MALGILVGFVALKSGCGKFITDWIVPWGTIFIRLLKLVAIPLVFLSLVKGIAHLENVKKLSRIGIKTMAIYVATTVFAIAVGLVMVYAVRPGGVFPPDKAQEYREFYGVKLGQSEVDMAAVHESGPLQFIVDMVPDNLFGAMADNTRMLQIIFVTLLFGVALVALDKSRTTPVISLVDGLTDIVLPVLAYIMIFAPWGVLALMAELVVGFGGDASIFAALGMYIVTLVSALLILIFAFYPVLVKLFTGLKIKKFFKVISPVQLLAFSTSSSAATLPLTMEQTEKGLGVSDEVASFVLPVGVTINMDGTSCYQAVAVIFIAQVMGLELSFTQLLTVVLVTTISSIGTPGIPSGSVVMLMMVLGSIGIPAEWLALILGVDRPLDMVRTVANVTGDMTVACIVEEGERKRR